MNIEHDANLSVESWKESVRLTMVNQESVFRHQLEELHRIYKKQVELMEEFGIGQSHGELAYTRRRSKKPKLTLKEKPFNLNELNRDTDAPVTPETRNRTTGQGKLALLEDKDATSAADTLVAMSSSKLRVSSGRLLWFAKIVTTADFTAVRKRTRLPRKPAQRGKERAQEIQMPGQQGKCQMAKKGKGVRVGPCVSGWGKIKNGRRSTRIPDSNPLYTFQRGALLCRWR